jgi:hypothetical protein
MVVKMEMDKSWRIEKVDFIPEKSIYKKIINEFLKLNYKVGKVIIDNRENKKPDGILVGLSQQIKKMGLKDKIEVRKVRNDIFLVNLVR